MKKIVKLVYAFAMLGVMLYAVVGLGKNGGAQSPQSIISDVRSMIESGLSGLQSAVSKANTVSSGQPIPLLQGSVSTPSQDTAPVQAEGTSASDYAQTGMQRLSVYTYGRTLLNANEQAAYDRVQTGLVGMETSVSLESPLTPAAMQKVVQYLISDHAEVFYLGGTFMSYTSSGTGGTRQFTISFTYSYGQSTVAAMRERLRAAALSMTAQANGKSDLVKKELALHDALVEKCAYSVTAADNPSGYPQAFTAYGALVDGSAVCEGYAKAFKLLLDNTGLRSLYVTGTADSGSESGPHAWNMVYVGKWYQADATFDDPVYRTSSGKYVQTGRRDYTYFNFVSKTDHVLGTFDVEKPFSSDSENYAVMPGLG